MSRIDKITLAKYSNIRKGKHSLELDSLFVGEKVLLQTKMYCLTTEGKDFTFTFELYYSDTLNNKLSHNEVLL